MGTGITSCSAAPGTIQQGKIVSTWEGLDRPIWKGEDDEEPWGAVEAYLCLYSALGGQIYLPGP